MRPVPEFPTDQLTVIAWPDEVIDRVGHDARSRYVETYWLGVLGPSATWLLRRIADELEANPSGYVMNVAETAQCIGVGAITRNSPFMRAMGRLCQFDLAHLQSSNVLAVRRRVPTLARRHVSRLTVALQTEHTRWQREQLEHVS